MPESCAPAAANRQLCDGLLLYASCAAVGAATSLMTESSTPPDRTNVTASPSAGDAVVYSTICCPRSAVLTENRFPREWEEAGQRLPLA
jgi:hypothetical protein